VQFKVSISSSYLELEDFRNSLLIRKAIIYELNDKEWLVFIDSKDAVDIPLLTFKALSCPIMPNIEKYTHPHGSFNWIGINMRANSNEKAFHNRMGNDFFVGVFDSLDANSVKGRYSLRHCYLYDEKDYSDFYSRAYDSIVHHRRKLSSYDINFPKEYYISLSRSTLKKVRVVGNKADDVVLTYD
jgi:hypothetical protein